MIIRQFAKNCRLNGDLYFTLQFDAKMEQNKQMKAHIRTNKHEQFAKTCSKCRIWQLKKDSDISSN